MTPEHFSVDELLSAGHDGELTAEERAEVERRLAESPAARELQDDFGELSRLMRSLPRPAAPTELQPLVLSRLHPPSRTAPEPAAPPRRRTSGWRLWVGSAAASAAALLIAAVWLHRPDIPHTGMVASSDSRPQSAPGPRSGPQSSRDPQSAPTPMAESDQSAPLEAFAGGRPQRGGADAGVGVSANADEQRRDELNATRRGRVPPLQPAPRTAGGAPPGGRPPALTPAPGAPTIRPGASPVDRSRLEFDPRSPPAVLDLLAYVDRVADRTVIVELEVVDVDQTADELLVLLRKRGVQVLGDGDGAENQAAARAAPASPNGPADQSLVIGVFVEATDDRLAEMLDEVAVHLPIADGAAFQEEFAHPSLQERLRRLEQEVAEERRRRTRAQSTAAPSAADVADSRPIAPAVSQARSDSAPAGSPAAPGEIAGADAAHPPSPSAPVPARSNGAAGGGLSKAAAPEVTAREWSVRLPLPASRYRFASNGVAQTPGTARVLPATEQPASVPSDRPASPSAANAANAPAGSTPAGSTPAGSTLAGSTPVEADPTGAPAAGAVASSPELRRLLFVLQPASPSPRRQRP